MTIVVIQNAILLIHLRNHVDNSAWTSPYRDNNNWKFNKSTYKQSMNGHWRSDKLLSFILSLSISPFHPSPRDRTVFCHEKSSLTKPQLTTKLSSYTTRRHNNSSQHFKMFMIHKTYILDEKKIPRVAYPQSTTNINRTFTHRGCFVCVVLNW